MHPRPAPTPPRAAQIADFGLAAVTAPAEGALNAQCGTPEFTAPEIVGGKEYDGQAVRRPGTARWRGKEPDVAGGRLRD
jgi:serine/threonine protein kinase